MSKLSLLVCLLVLGCQSIGSSHKLTKEEVDRAIDRYENDEIVCYRIWSGSGISSSCKWKE